MSERGGFFEGGAAAAEARDIRALPGADGGGMSAPTPVNPPRRRSKDGAGQQTDQGHHRMAKEMGSLAEDRTPRLTPAKASETSTAACQLKGHSAWRGSAVLIRIGRYRLQLSGTHGALFLQEPDGSLRRACSSECEEDHQSILGAIEACLAQPLRQAQRRTAATLRCLLREGVFGTKAVRPLPNRHRCPNPSVEAPCEDCMGCARNGFRFRVSQPNPVDLAAHRLSETSK